MIKLSSDLSTMLADINLYSGCLSWGDIMPIIEKIETTTWFIPSRFKTGYLKREQCTTMNIEFDALFDPRTEFIGWSCDVRIVLACNSLISNDTTRYASKLEAMQTALIMFAELYNKELFAYVKEYYTTG